MMRMMKRMRPTKVCSTTLVYLNIFEKMLIVGGKRLKRRYEGEGE
jgi:hypothetical protein